MQGIITGSMPEKDKLSSLYDNADDKRKITYTITIFHIAFCACAVPIYTFKLYKLIYCNTYKTRNDLRMSIEAYRRSGHINTVVS